jgi:hypothetical protein
VVSSFLLASGVSAQQPGGEMRMSMMDSADARLDRLVSTMNQTTGSRKVQAMAAVINELVTQRKTMRTHARQMMMGPGGMMGNQMGGGRNMPNRKPASPDTAPTPAKPDTTDHGQHHQP